MRWKSPGRSGFEKLRSASTARSGPITVSWLPAAAPPPPVLAFAISKRVGNAVVRNRVRRRLREAARRYPELPGGTYLIRTSPGAASLAFPVLCDHLARAIGDLVQRRAQTPAQHAPPLPPGPLAPGRDQTT